MTDVDGELGLDAAQDAALRAFEAEAGEVFPQLGAAQAGDEALVAALAERATVSVGASATASAGSIVGIKTIAIAAAVIVAGVVAILATRGDAPTEPVAAAPAAAVERELPPDRAPTVEPAPPSVVAPAPVEADADRSADPSDDEPVVAPASKPTRERPREAAPAVDAAELLRQGNESRRAGEHAKAREIYRRIRKEFPGTREDLLVRVSLGQLALDHFDDPKDALVHFGAYLRDKPKGTLAEEASLGRIAALRRLGRTVDERAALERFLASFPDSIQKDTVGRRLAEIDR